jgi:hypothetical protein
MECCDKKQSKQDFLLSKARNFRDFITKYEPDEAVTKYIATFNESTLYATLFAVVVPIVHSKTTGSAVADLMKKLKVPESEKADVASKIQRYLEMFAAVITS